MESWSAPQMKGRPTGKTMILCVGENAELVRQYEDLIAENFNALGVESDALHALVEKPEPFTKEDLVEALQKNHYNSILVTRLISKTNRQQSVSTGTMVGYTHYYEYYRNSLSTSVGSVEVVTLEINLFDVNSEQIIWTARQSLLNDRPETDSLKNLITATIGDLQKRGLLN